MELLRRWLLPTLIDILTLILQAYIYRFLRETAWVKGSAIRRRTLTAVYYALVAYMVLIVPQLIAPGGNFFGPMALSLLLAATMLWLVVLLSLGLWVRLHLMRVKAVKLENPGRRAFLRAATPVLAIAPTALVATGMVRARSQPGMKEVKIYIRGLHPDLNGLRIAQLTDIHFGPFFGKRDLERAVAMANETKPHISLITGDLITRHGDDLHGCLNVLKAVRAESGIWACHGNHEQYAGVEEEATVLGERQGFRYLRGSSEILRFGNAKLNLSGIDYHSLGDEPLSGAEEWLVNDALNILLSHTPSAFDRAAQVGFDLTISGHTHGGQLTVPLGPENLTFARIYTPYIQGKYEKDGKQLYVSSGLGTVGMPVRIGADPEVTLIRLCAI